MRKTEESEPGRYTVGDGGKTRLVIAGFEEGRGPLYGQHLNVGKDMKVDSFPEPSEVNRTLPTPLFLTQ